MLPVSSGAVTLWFATRPLILVPCHKAWANATLEDHMLALAKDVNHLYPELIKAGGLVNALQMALRTSGSPHTVFGRSVNIGVVCARVDGERRRCQAYIVEQRRLFVFDLWAGNSILVGATAGSVMDVAGRVHQWLATTCSAADVVAGLERVSVNDDGMVYDAHDDVDRAWHDVSNGPILGWRHSCRRLQNVTS